jgi:cell division protein FtsI/penicillin-binding protein 2
MRGFAQLTRPLLGEYRGLPKKGHALEKHLAAGFYPTHGFGFSRSYSYRQPALQGSIFKLVTAYATLVERQAQNLVGNPLTVIDDVHRQPGKSSSWNVGYTADNRPIPQVYKGGRIPRSSRSHIGKVDLVSAIETSSNLYFALLAGEILPDPEMLVANARALSYGSKTGIDLPGEGTGHVPSDVQTNRTGLYAMAIGQHSLTATPLQTATMLCALANGGKVLKPQIVRLAAGKEPVRTTDSLFLGDQFHYRDYLSLVGLDFPLFTQAQERLKKSLVTSFPTEVRRLVPLPTNIRQTLLQGMRQVIVGERGQARVASIRSYGKYPEAIRDYKDLMGQIVGKSSTAERVERIDLDGANGLQIVNHLWFAMIAFEKEITPQFERPELVVVVYLPYGDYGKEAAPIAAQMVKKWRQIKQAHKI